MADVSAPRHARYVRKSAGALAWKFFRGLKWWYLPLLLSDYTREILRRKYDAIATDRAYENRSGGLLWPLGKALDRAVLNFPVHVALRQRLDIVTSLLQKEIRHHAVTGGTVRVLSAPCGLARDVLAAAGIPADGAAAAGKLDLHGIDLDASGEVLALAEARAREAGLQMTFSRADLFRFDDVRRVVGSDPFHVVNSIGLTAWIDLDEVADLVHTFHRLLVPGGSLIVDNWAKTRHASIAEDLEIFAVNHQPEQFISAIRKAGFDLNGTYITKNEVATVYVFQRTG